MSKLGTKMAAACCLTAAAIAALLASCELALADAGYCCGSFACNEDTSASCGTGTCASGVAPKCDPTGFPPNQGNPRYSQGTSQKTCIEHQNTNCTSIGPATNDCTIWYFCKCAADPNGTAIVCQSGGQNNGSRTQVPNCGGNPCPANPGGGGGGGGG